jgi:ribosome-associated protein
MGKLREATSEEIRDKAIEGIQRKKGHDIVVLDLDQIEIAVCRYFVICHGESNTQVTALAESVEEVVKKDLQEHVWHREGYRNAQWILLDYGDVVIHIFEKPYREFYDLEGLWADAEREDVSDEQKKERE